MAASVIAAGHGSLAVAGSVIIGGGVCLIVVLLIVWGLVAYARQFYNSAVQTYNTTVQSLPTNIVAGIGGFRVESLFEAADAERGPVQVHF